MMRFFNVFTKPAPYWALMLTWAIMLGGVAKAVAPWTYGQLVSSAALTPSPAPTGYYGPPLIAQAAAAPTGQPGNANLYGTYESSVAAGSADAYTWLNYTSNTTGLFASGATVSGVAGTAMEIAQNGGSNLLALDNAGNLGLHGGIAPTTPVAIAYGGNGTATPALTAGSNVTLSGSWPNYTINASGLTDTETLINCGSTSSPCTVQGTCFFYGLYATYNVSSPHTLTITGVTPGGTGSANGLLVTAVAWPASVAFTTTATPSAVYELQLCPN